MPSTRSFFLIICISISRVLGALYASFHHQFIKYGFLSVSPVIKNAPGGLYSNLRQIWFVRCFRRIVSVLVRSSLRHHVLQLIGISGTGHITPGTVIVSCHTPWSRLIALWCAENYSYRLIGWGPWVKRTSIARHAIGFREIREILSYLRSGGRVIIMGDVFNKTGNCPCRFLENNFHVSVFPVRLAKAAQALLTTQIPVFKNDQIKIIEGLQFIFADSSGQGEDCKIMQMILSFIEKEIRMDPSIWMGYIRGSLSAKQN